MPRLTTPPCCTPQLARLALARLALAAQLQTKPASTHSSCYTHHLQGPALHGRQGAQRVIQLLLLQPFRMWRGIAHGAMPATRAPAVHDQQPGLCAVVRQAGGGGGKRVAHTAQSAHDDHRCMCSQLALTSGNTPCHHAYGQGTCAGQPTAHPLCTHQTSVTA